MILTNVEIEGFRGIKNRLEIELSPSLTVIYGPNFFGKSSILEAPEWCLLCASEIPWQTLRKIYHENRVEKLIHTECKNAFVRIFYEVEGGKNQIWVNTTGEWSYDKFVEGPFRNFKLERVAIQNFIIGISKAQFSQVPLASAEKLKEAIDLIFGVQPLSKLAEKLENQSENLFKFQKECREQILKLKEGLEKEYLRRYRKLDSLRENFSERPLEEIREEIADFIKDPKEIPSTAKELSEFIETLERKNPWQKESKRLEKEIWENKRRIEEEGKKKREIEEEARLINEKRENLEAAGSKEKWEEKKRRIDTEIERKGKALNSKLEEWSHLPHPAPLRPKLEDLKRDHGRAKELIEEIKSSREKLSELNETTLEEQLKAIENRLSTLEEQRTEEKEKEGKIGDKLGLLKEANSVMTKWNIEECIICGSPGGKRRAEKHLEDIEKGKTELAQALEKLCGEIDKANRTKNEVKEKFNQVNRIKASLEEGERELESFEGKYNSSEVELLNEIGNRIESRGEEIKQMERQEEEIKNELDQIEGELEGKRKELIESQTKIKEIESLEQNICDLFLKLGLEPSSVPLQSSGARVLDEKKRELEEGKESLSREVEDIKEKLSHLEDEKREIQKQKEIFEEKFESERERFSGELEIRRLREEIKNMELSIELCEERFEKIEEVLSKIETDRLPYDLLQKTIESKVKSQLIKEKSQDFNDLLSKYFPLLHDNPDYPEIYLEPVDGGYEFKLRDSFGKIKGREVLSASGKDLLELALYTTNALLGPKVGEENFNLLLIDEPQRFLDSNHKRKLVEFLHEISEEKSLQVILATMDEELWQLLKEDKISESLLYKIKSRGGLTGEIQLERE